MLTVDFADVLCQIPAIGIPCAVDLNSQRAGGNGLCRIPCNMPQAGMVTACKVATSDLLITAIDEALTGHGNASCKYLCTAQRWTKRIPPCGNNSPRLVPFWAKRLPARLSTHLHPTSSCTDLVCEASKDHRLWKTISFRVLHSGWWCNFNLK